MLANTYGSCFGAHIWHLLSCLHVVVGNSVARSSPSPSSIPVVYCDGCCLNNGAKEAKAGVGVFWEEGSPQ